MGGKRQQRHRKVCPICKKTFNGTAKQVYCSNRKCKEEGNRRKALERYYRNKEIEAQTKSPGAQKLEVVEAEAPGPVETAGALTATQTSLENARIFENETFGHVRVIEIDGEPWFVAADVCRSLDIGNPSQALARLDNGEKSTLILKEGTSPRGGNPNVNVINEPGLYSLVLSSRKPEAVQFKRWVTSEILPSIRKTGAYAPMSVSADSDLDFMENMVRAIRASRESVRNLEKVANEHSAQISEIKADVADNEKRLDDIESGKAGRFNNEYAKYLPTDIAQFYPPNVTPHLIYQILEKEGYAKKAGKKWHLTSKAKAADPQLVVMVEKPVTNQYGKIISSIQLYFTDPGKRWIARVLKNQGYRSLNECWQQAEMEQVGAAQ